MIRKILPQHTLSGAKECIEEKEKQKIA